MNPVTIADTVAGALELSAIDFLLSFAFIGAIGVLLHFLPRLTRFVRLGDTDLTHHG
jgi:hypothetical protein